MTLEAYLANASAEVTHLLATAAGGMVAVDTLRVRGSPSPAVGSDADARWRATRADVLARARQVAGPLPKPRGKAARRLRQAASAEQDRRAAAATSLAAGSEPPGWGCVVS